MMRVTLTQVLRTPDTQHTIWRLYWRFYWRRVMREMFDKLGQVRGFLCDHPVGNRALLRADKNVQWRVIEYDPQRYRASLYRMHGIMVGYHQRHKEHYGRLRWIRDNGFRFGEMERDEMILHMR